MAKEKPIKPLIRALAEHIADDVIASHDAKLPKRKRLPRSFYEKELAKEEPAKVKPKRQSRRKAK
jgi:hypothetical protein